MDAIGWLIICLALVLFEIVTMGLTTIWFAAGALAAFIIALFSLPLWLQILVFVVVSLVTLVVTRPLAQKYINSKTTRTNVESMTGKVGKVEERIDNIEASGRVMIEGNSWLARSKNDEVIEEGVVVKVISVEGVKVIVERE